MNEMLQQSREIVVEEHLPHPPAKVWRALVSPQAIGRWLMVPTGFEPVEGCRFTFQTTPAGNWDGTIACEVLEAQPNERLSYSWRGGDEGNEGYGSKLDTVVTYTLNEDAGGTRLRIVHSGFKLPKNAVAVENMGRGWRTIAPRLGGAIDEGAA